MVNLSVWVNDFVSIEWCFDIKDGGFNFELLLGDKYIGVFFDDVCVISFCENGLCFEDSSCDVVS